MRPDGFGLLGDSNGDLEEVPEVLGLLGFDIRHFGKVDSKPLDNAVGQGGSLGSQVRGGSLGE